jgi:hypothetical protein
MLNSGERVRVESRSHVTRRTMLLNARHGGRSNTPGPALEQQAREVRPPIVIERPLDRGSCVELAPARCRDGSVSGPGDGPDGSVRFSMDDRERMLAAIARAPTDRLPWAPRMDLWLIARRARGSLPSELRLANTVDVARYFGFACHAVRGDFTTPRDPADWALRGFGIENHADFPYRVEVSGLPVEFVSDGERYRTTIRTAAGDATAVLEMTDAMRRDGMSIPYVKKRPIDTQADFEAVAQVFEHLEVVPTPAAYAAFRARIGGHGLAVAQGPVAASPIHLILHDLMNMEAFFYLYMDEPSQLHRLADRLRPYFDAALDALLQCDAEMIWWGANYDQQVTWPAFFRAEFVPGLQTVGNRVRERGSCSRHMPTARTTSCCRSSRNARWTSPNRSAQHRWSRIPWPSCAGGWARGRRSGAGSHPSPSSPTR